MRFALTLIALATLLAACSAPRRMPVYSSAAVLAPPKYANPASNSALKAAIAKVSEAKRLVPGFDASDSLLAQAQAAAAQGNSPRAQTLALEAQTRAELALDGYYVVASAQELQRLYNVTGLSDRQLGKLREAEVKLVRGEGARAYALLQQLGKELRSDKRHKVASGESLWTISAKPEIYANGYLWPLIWEANKDRVPNPNVLQEGQSLRIRPNPTVDEVVRAVEYARSRMANSRVRIGKLQQEEE